MDVSGHLQRPIAVHTVENKTGHSRVVRIGGQLCTAYSEVSEKIVARASLRVCEAFWREWAQLQTRFAGVTRPLAPFPKNAVRELISCQPYSRVVRIGGVTGAGASFRHGADFLFFSFPDFCLADSSDGITVSAPPTRVSFG